MSGHAGSGWINVPEAARRAGVAPDTMRKRAARGHVEARKETINGVPQWFIRADSLGPDVSGQPQAGDTGTPASGLDGPDTMAMLAEIRDLLATMVEGQRAMMEEQRALRAALESRATPAPIPALPAPSEPVRTAPERPSYPWWHWRRWVLV